MFEISQIACLRGERLLFRQLSFNLKAGELLRLTGTNGIGKTSLLRLLCGLSQPEIGEVLWEGKSIKKQRDIFHAALLYLGHSVAQSDLLSPLENLLFACRSVGDSVCHDACSEALQRIGLAKQFDLPCKALSQGQRRRVGLARLFLSPHRKLWILDEPFAALDFAAIEQLAQTIDAHCANNGMVIFTSHQDVDFATPLRQLEMGDFVA